MLRDVDAVSQGVGKVSFREENSMFHYSIDFEFIGESPTVSEKTVTFFTSKPEEG